MLNKNEMTIHYSEYTDGCKDTIRALFADTFTDSEGAAEGELIGNLAYDLLTTTDAEDIRIFTAHDAGKIVGSIIFTALTFENGARAFLLAPVAIRTEFQGKGIGQALIGHGLARLKELGIEAVFTYGDPAFYSKTGFSHISEDRIQACFKLSAPEGWLCQSLTGNSLPALTGTPKCVKAFSNPDFW